MPPSWLRQCLATSSGLSGAGRGGRRRRGCGQADEVPPAEAAPAYAGHCLSRTFSLPFLEISLPFHYNYSPFHCLSLTAHCLFPDLSLPSVDLSTASRTWLPLRFSHCLFPHTRTQDEAEAAAAGIADGNVPLGILELVQAPGERESNEKTRDSP